MRKKLLLVSSWCLVGLVLVFVNAPVIRAQQDTVVRCRFENPSINIGAETIIYLEVLDVVDLFAYQLDMAFDSELAEVSGSPGDPEDTRMVLGDFLVTDFEVYNEIHNDFGAIFIALTQFVPSPPQSGSGVLAYGYASGLQDGAVEFIFEEVILLDPEGVEIPHSQENCTLLIGTGGQVTETPTEVLTASPTNTPTETLAPPSDTPVSSGTLTATQTQPAQEDTQTPEPTAASSPTETAQPSLTPIPGSSDTPTISPTAQPSGTPTMTLTPQPSNTPTSGFSPTPLASIVITTETPYPSSTPTVISTPTDTLTMVPTLSPTPRPLSGFYMALCGAFCFAIIAVIAVLAGLLWYVRQS